MYDSYYELHEEFWQGLVRQGHISWDNESEEDLLSRERNTSYESAICGFLVGGITLILRVI